jgi:hypothetical protein
MLEALLVFYGYLSISFGWLYYLVVFISLGVALYTYARTRDIYTTAERYIKSLITLGIIDLSISAAYAAAMTIKWLI